MRADDACGGRERGVGRDAAIGPHVEDELLVVGAVADALGLDLEVDAGDGREDAVDRYDADLLILALVPFCRMEAVAQRDLRLKIEGDAVSDGGDLQIRVDDLDGVLLLEVAGGDHAWTLAMDGDALRNGAGDLDEDLLEGDDDVRDILGDALDRHELVARALELDGRDRDALDRGEEHAAEGVADRLRVAALEGLGREAGVGGRGGSLVLHDAFRHYELAVGVGHSRFLPCGECSPWATSSKAR